MDDIGAQLNKILSDPQSMSQIQSIMNGLGVSSNSQPLTAASSTSNDNSANLGSILNAVATQPQEVNQNHQEPSAQQGLGIDPNMIGTIAKLAPLLNSAKADDESSRLLLALKPMLSSEKNKKIDDAIKVMQIMKMLPTLKESGILSSVLGNLF